MEMLKNKDRVKVAYLTDDIGNKNKNKTFNRINQELDIKLITSRPGCGLYKVEDVVNIDIDKADLRGKLYNFLSLFSFICNSKTSTYFPKRNFYRKNGSLINIVHYIKLFLSRINALPKHSDIVTFVYGNDSRFDELIEEFDIFIFDSLLINTKNFHSILGRLSKLKTKKLVADVYSWDNVHYSSLCHFCDFYLVWNDVIKDRMIKNHPEIVTKNIIITGPQFMEYLSELKPKKLCEKYIMYAAVYCDEVMGSVEKEIIIEIANILYRNHPQYKLLFRPYPSMNASFYEEIMQHEQIVFADYGVLEDRFGDGEEKIRVESSLQNKLNLLSNACAFISLGSTITFEAAYFDVPVIQLNLNEERFQIIKTRTSISDHILGTFIEPNYPNVASNLDEVKGILCDILSGKDHKYKYFNSCMREFIRPVEGVGNMELYLNAILHISKQI